MMKCRISGHVVGLAEAKPSSRYKVNTDILSLISRSCSRSILTIAPRIEIGRRL